MGILNKRGIEDALKADFFTGKAILILGPRQIGKTTLANKIIRKFEAAGKKVLELNCDNPTDRESLDNRNLTFLQGIVGDADIVFIDEGQKVATIGQTIKLLVDFYRERKQFIVTGSSSFNLLDQTNEALTGRKYVYNLYPLSIAELYPDRNTLHISKDLETLLVYGTYPAAINNKNFDAKRRVLEELSSSQLYKDILEFQGVKDTSAIRNLLKALALQVGSEVSYTELSRRIGVDKNTVARYIDLLEKSFIVFRVAPYFVNKRKEISKMKKVYFYDNGIRNAIIHNFNALDVRNDVGALWENFLFVERMKKRAYTNIYAHQYFWRTYAQKEIDLVEERDGELFGYEFKWNTTKHPKVPRDWQLLHSNTHYTIINRENYLDFIA